MKKLASLLCAVLLCFSLCAPASAILIDEPASQWVGSNEISPRAIVQTVRIDVPADGQ